MSESQFAYSSFTLDELRSLAASPQVGTMQAMPQSFRALADRVGEVADLLSHAQADLPNWWKGPAANQAAASLGRAAAEAREFQGNALAAASSVSRCAQVVAAQQNQMLDVPDVREPGITDVVQRPTTLFETLEDARQDAAYQAAHRQAVQVVNGIAAQYVETRDELTLITVTRGENFTAPTAIQDISTREVEESPASDTIRIGSGTETRQESSEPQYRSLTGHSLAEHAPLEKERVSTGTGEAHYAAGWHEPHLTQARPPSSVPRESDPFTMPDQTVEGSTPPNTLSRPTESGKTIAGTQDKTITLGNFNDIGEDIAPRRPSKPDSLETSSLTSKTRETNRQVVGHPSDETRGKQTADTLKKRGSAENIEQILARQIGSTEMSHAPDINDIDPHSRLSAPPNQNHPGEANSGNAAIIPQYAGVGSASRTRERSSRPAYLKERKSVWLPEIIAAPADGVIRPD